jgi:hypothetical protein
VRSSTRRDPSAQPARPRVSSPGAESARRKERHQWRSPGHQTSPQPPRLVVSSGAQEISLREDRREIICSLIGLSVKLGLVVMAGVSLCRLAGAYQERMERQGELSAVLEIEKAQLAKARHRFDQLFMVEGEQKLIREQSQWIAPNRMRVVWQTNDPLPEKPVLAMQQLPSAPQRP